MWPAYKIARHYFEPSAAVVAALGFVLTPAIFYQNPYDFAPLSLAGLPPLAGFFSKLYLFWAAAQAGLYITVVWGVLNSAISLAMPITVAIDPGPLIPGIASGKNAISWCAGFGSAPVSGSWNSIR